VNAKLWAGGAVAALLLVLAAAGPTLAPHDPNRQDLISVRQPPANPATAPMPAPTISDTSTVTTPTASETRVP
jgi:hypothetical protein